MVTIRIPKLVGQIGLSSGSAVIVQGTTLLLVVFLSNLLGPSGLARFAVTQNTVTAISSVAQAGLSLTASTYIAKYHFRDDSLTRQILRLCLGVTLVLGCVVAGILALGSNLIATEIYGDGKLANMVLIAAATLPFAAVVLTQNGVLNGFARYKSQFWTAVVSSAILLAAAGLGAVFWGAMGSALGFAGATLVRATILWRVIALHVPSPAAKDFSLRETWSRIRNFAIPAGLAGLTLTPSTWLASALLLNFRGLEELGVFLAALSIRSAVSFLPQQIGTTFLPYFLRLDGNSGVNESYYFGRILALMTGVAVIVSVPIALFSPYILSVFGSEFIAGSTILNCLLLGVVIESASLAFSNRYAARERMWSVLLFFTFPKDILLVIVAFVAIPTFGGLGLAIAYLTSALYGLFSYALIAKSQDWQLFGQGSRPDDLP